MESAELKDKLLDLWGQKKKNFGFSLIDTENDITMGFQDEVAFNIASCYKVFVLAELFRQIEKGLVHLSEELEIGAGNRIFDSSATDSLPDGSLLSVQALAKAMMESSDNTATELLQSRLGINSIRELLEEHGLIHTRFPDSLHSLMDVFSQPDLFTEEAAAKVFKGELGIISTPLELASFYESLLDHNCFQKEETLDQIKEILILEDQKQRMNWPEGVTCYRKSGNIDLDYYYGFSIAGAIQKQEVLYPFALCLNFNHEESVEEMLQLFKDTFRVMREYILR